MHYKYTERGNKPQTKVAGLGLVVLSVQVVGVRDVCKVENLYNNTAYCFRMKNVFSKLLCLLTLITCSVVNGWGRPGPFYHVTSIST